MDQRRDRGRPLHGVGQPGVEQELRRLAHRAHEEEEAGERQRVPLDAEEAEARIGEVADAREDALEGDRAEQHEDEEDTEGEAEIANPVDDEGLDGGGPGRVLLVPEADQEIARETVVTTISITAVRVSTRNAQSTTMSPEANHCPSWMRVVAPCSPTSTKAIHDRAQDRNRSAVVTTSLGRDPMRRPNSPAMRKPTSGRKTMAWYMV